jgi:hypothetical protein
MLWLAIPTIASGHGLVDVRVWIHGRLGCTSSTYRRVTNANVYSTRTLHIDMGDLNVDSLVGRERFATDRSRSGVLLRWIISRCSSTDKRAMEGTNTSANCAQFRKSSPTTVAKRRPGSVVSFERHRARVQEPCEVITEIVRESMREFLDRKRRRGWSGWRCVVLWHVHESRATPRIAGGSVQRSNHEGCFWVGIRMSLAVLARRFSLVGTGAEEPCRTSHRKAQKQNVRS